MSNPFVGLLVSGAAIELDRYQKGIDSDEGEIQHLGKILYEATVDEEGNLKSPGFASEIALYHTLAPEREKAQEYWSGKKTSDLVLQTHLASRELKNYKDLSNERLDGLIDFCSRLSLEVSRHLARNFSGRRGLAA